MAKRKSNVQSDGYCYLMKFMIHTEQKVEKKYNRNKLMNRKELYIRYKIEIDKQ